MTKTDARIEVISLIRKAQALIPTNLEPDLSPINGFPNIPDWHSYEHEIWKIGEQIRQILLLRTSLRKDSEILKMVLEICLNRNAKRGRQSFVMLLWHKHCKMFASQLITQIDDIGVNGHIIYGLNKMQAEGFGETVKVFTSNKITVIRKSAIKYMEKYGD